MQVIHLLSLKLQTEHMPRVLHIQQELQQPELPEAQERLPLLQLLMLQPHFIISAQVIQGWAVLQIFLEHLVVQVTQFHLKLNL